MRCLSLISLLFACTGENVIDKQHNEAPNITIQSHSDGAEILEGYIESFRAQVSDDDNQFEELEVAWFVGEEEVCPWKVASSAGESFCDIVFNPEDTSVVAEVRDTQGAGGRDEISITITETEAPVVEILSPTQSGSYYADQLIEFSALVSDLEDDISDLLISWSSSVDGELSISTEADSSGEISDAAYLSEGEHFIELRVEDSTEKVTTESVVIDVGGDNNEPLCEITEPASGSAYVVGQNISFSGTATDEDINNSLLSITWESDQDGEFNTTAANTGGELIFVYNGLTDGNHTITLRVEDEVEGLCTDTALVAIGTPPTITLTSPSSGDVVSLGEAAFFAATISDNEDIPSNITLSWESDIDGEFSTQGSDSSGNISFSEFSLTAGLHNITITATDSTGLTALTSLSLRINTPPTAPTVIISPDPANTNDTLTVTASGSSDGDGDSITYNYTWYTDGNLASNTTTSIPASDTSTGEVWTVRVTPNDGYVDGTYTEESSTIINSAPVLSLVTISPNTSVFTGTILTCSATASDPDDGVLIATYEWTVGTTSLGTGNSYTVSSADTNVGDTIVCTATAVDSDGETTSDVASVIIDNTPPTLSNLLITPNTAVYNDTILTCTATVTDPDETVLISYAWMISGIQTGTGTNLDLSTTLAIPGDIVECEANATDSQGTMDIQTVNVTIDNRVPSTPTVSISPSNPMEAVDDLVCSASASTDADGQMVTYFYSWTSDSGMSVSGDTVSASMTTAGEIWECTVIPNDGIDNGNSNSSSVTVNSTCPSLNASISTQTEADSYIPCTELNSIYLHMTSAVVTVDLPNLVTVHDSIYFHMNTDVETVSLPLLETVGGYVYFHQNSALTTVDLSALQSVTQYLYFNGNIDLQTIFIESIETVDEYISLSQNQYLSTFNTPLLTNVGESFSCSQNQSLTTVDAPLLQSIGGHLYFHQNQSLTTVEVPILESVDEYLYFDGNSILSTLNLSNLLTYVGDYSYFSNNPLLCIPNLNWNSIVQSYHYDNGNLDCTDDDGDGYTATQDCDDNDAAIFPGAPESCSGIDSNCDGTVCMNTGIIFGTTPRYLANNTGWGSAIDEATHFCEDHGFMGGSVVTWPAGDLDYVYSYLATPPTIYSGHIAPNIEVQREVHCLE